MTSSAKLPFPRFGTASAAYRVVFSVRSGTTLVPAPIDVVAITQGTVDAVVLFGSAGQTVPASFERQIVARVAARIAS